MVTPERQLLWIGGSTPCEDMDIIRARLKVAEVLAKEFRDEKASR